MSIGFCCILIVCDTLPEFNPASRRRFSSVMVSGALIGPSGKPKVSRGVSLLNANYLLFMPTIPQSIRRSRIHLLCLTCSHLPLMLGPRRYLSVRGYICVDPACIAEAFEETAVRFPLALYSPLNLPFGAVYKVYPHLMLPSETSPLPKPCLNHLRAQSLLPLALCCSRLYWEFFCHGS